MSHVLNDMDTCADCGVTIRYASDKALGSGEWEYVWVDNATGRWVCDKTGNEHRAKADVPPAPGGFIVVEGNPVDGFLFHGIPAFEDAEEAVEWAGRMCTREWWVAPLQDVE